MFDLGFSELVIIGVVALIVIGPERLPKVARTAGHMLGRFQRYAASVKSDISREMQLDELRKAGQGLKDSIESAASGVESQANIVDDYLKNEIGQVKQALSVDAAPPQDEADEPHPQQSLDLAAPPTAVVEIARPDAERPPSA